MKDLFNQEPIRALTWWEPYASLMLPPFNKIETRTWSTKYRGLVLICSAKKFMSESDIMSVSGPFYTQRIFTEMSRHHIKEKRGFAIAVGRLVDCRLMQPIDEAQCFVKYDPTKYVHIYEDVKPIEPFKWKGSQGWKKLTEEEKQLIKYKNYE